jgi:hypothetical protein
MWMIDSKLLCRKHLLGEHVELHMLAGTIAKGISIAGYVENGLAEIHSIIPRHEELAVEMIQRGYNHRSELKISLPLISGQSLGHVDQDNSIKELSKRCPDCRARITKGGKLLTVVVAVG